MPSLGGAPAVQSHCKPPVAYGMESIACAGAAMTTMIRHKARIFIAFPPSLFMARLSERAPQRFLVLLHDVQRPLQGLDGFGVLGNLDGVFAGVALQLIHRRHQTLIEVEANRDADQ